MRNNFIGSCASVGAKHCCPVELFWSILLFLFVSVSRVGWCDDAPDKLLSSAKALVAMKKATDFMTSQVAVHGGYVYDVTLDLKVRRGEGKASATEVWVQPPGTPAVGLAFIKAYDATGEQVFLDAATQCAHALLHGQLESGCWTDRVDFDPNGENTGRYRKNQGMRTGRNYSTLDDDKSQAALRCLIEVDRAHGFKETSVHEGVQFGLEALLKAQFANGGFPQGWEKPVEPGLVVQASFPKYDWRTEGRFKNYWDYATLNDGLAGTVTSTLQLAYETYRDERYRQAMLKFGDFLILAQLPEPQPAWAQQYNHQLQPMWARKFEPPAVVGHESEDVIKTLMYLVEKTGERKYLQPIPSATAWLKRSELPDGKLARFYELGTNKPLYFTKQKYLITYDDSDLPTHYGFKTKPKVHVLEKQYESLAKEEPIPSRGSNLKTLRQDATRICAELDSQGRWVTDEKGNSLSESAKRDPRSSLIQSEVFSRNLTKLAEFIAAEKLEMRK